LMLDLDWHFSHDCGGLRCCRDLDE
jgi:hypothetical protein